MLKARGKQKWTHAFGNRPFRRRRNVDESQIGIGSIWNVDDGNLNAAISRVCLDIEFRSFWSRDYLRPDCFLVFAPPMYFPLQCMLFVLLKAHLRPLLADWEMLPKAASCTAGAESILSSSF